MKKIYLPILALMLTLTSCLPLPSAEDTLLALDNIEDYLNNVSSSPLYTRNLIINDGEKESKYLISYDPSNFYFHIRKEVMNKIENELWVYVNKSNFYILNDTLNEKTGTVEYLENVSQAQERFISFMESIDEIYKKTWVEISKEVLNETKNIVNSIINFENDNDDYVALEELSYSTSFDDHGNFSLFYKEVEATSNYQTNIVFDEYYLREYSLIREDEENNYYEMSEIFTLGVPLEYPDVKEFEVEAPISVSAANELLDKMETYLNEVTSRPAYQSLTSVTIGEEVILQTQKIDLDNYYFYQEKQDNLTNVIYAYVEDTNFVEVNNNTYTLSECTSVEDARALFDNYIMELESVTQGNSSLDLNKLTLITIASLRNLLESASSLTSRGEGHLNFAYLDSVNNMSLDIELEKNYLTYTHQTTLINGSDYISESNINVGEFDLVYPNLNEFEKVDEL